MSRAECLTTPGVVLALIASLSGSGHVHREFLRPLSSLSFFSVHRHLSSSSFIVSNIRRMFSLSPSVSLAKWKYLVRQQKEKNTPVKVGSNVGTFVTRGDFKVECRMQ